jgi:hypothetical protein
MQNLPQPVRLSLLSCLLLILTACAHNPVRTAQTPEQKGDALYGIYVIAKEQGAALLQDATIPDDAKRPLAEAMVKSAKPAGNLQDAVAAFGTGGTAAQIQAAIVAAQPLINDLVAALVKVKPAAAPLADQLKELK